MIGKSIRNRFDRIEKVVLYCLCAIVISTVGLLSTARAQPSYPDLIVTSVSGPSKGGPGMQMTVTFSIQNQGPVDVSCGNDFRVGLYLSTDGVITTDDILLGKITICGINAGAVTTVPATVTIPAGVANGTYFLGAIVDVDGNVAESDETNNSLAGNTITISNLPDLVITSVASPANGYTDGTINVPVTVANTGYSDGFARDIYFYLSPTPLITAASVTVWPNGGSSLYPSYAVATTIAPGASETFTPQLWISPDFTPGMYYVIAKVTAGTESDTTNNMLAGSVPITIMGPDVSVVAVSGPASAHNGDTISVTNTVAAKGWPGGTVCYYSDCWWVAGYVTVQVGLFKNITDTVPYAILTNNGTYIARTIYSQALGAGGTNTDNTSVGLPTTVAPGTYYLGAIATSTYCDDFGSCQTSSETNTTNNLLLGNQITIQ